MSKFIDLSVQLDEKTPVYPGDPKTEVKEVGILDKDGYEDHYLCVGTHVGTHIDSPAHMIKEGKNLNDIPLEHFSGRGVCIKIANGNFDLDEIRKVPLLEGDIVLFHTAMSDHYYTPKYFENYPEIPESVANYLVEKKIKILGVDMCSPDHPPFKTHKILLQNNILIIENLTNLSALDGKEFKIFSFPPKVALDGSPTRVVAEII